VPFARRLLAWHGRHGRHDLPWQQDPSPYRVWVSEIMLQQTQVSTVIGYYARFMQRFPDVQSLAAAPQDEVLHLWTGLGYYARARNLQRAAQQICELHSGEFPTDFAAVAGLPGIGRSTAAAILALASGQRHAILDGNVKRVLTRHQAVGGWPGDKRVETKLWALAEAYTPKRRVAEYTQAIMDLGATLCTRTRPRCGECPVAADCRAHGAGHVTRYPAPRPRKEVPMKQTRMLMVRAGDAVLLTRRPSAGIWGGLWSFHEIDAEADPREWCHRHLGVKPVSCLFRPVLRHTFSHFHLDIEPVEITLSAAPPQVADGADELWYRLDAPARLGLAAPVKRLLQALTLDTSGEGQDGTHGQMRLVG
jgi:A/G-specific adenine glycosylase